MKEEIKYRCTERYSFGVSDLRSIYGTEYKPIFWDRYGDYIVPVVCSVLFIGVLCYQAFVENADKGVRVLPL